MLVGRTGGPFLCAVGSVGDVGDWPAWASAGGVGMLIDVDQSVAVPKRWELRANCSMSPAVLVAAVGGLSAVSLLIGAFFWWMGAPAVLPFACVEMLCLVMALLIYARRAADGDVVERVGSDLRVRSMRQGREMLTVLPACWTRVRCVGAAGIELSSGHRRVLVGRHVRPELRLALARDIRNGLVAEVDRNVE